MVDDCLRLALDCLAVDWRQDFLARSDERAVDFGKRPECRERAEFGVFLFRKPGVLHVLRAAVANYPVLQAPFQVAHRYGVREHAFFFVHVVRVVKEPAQLRRAARHLVDCVLEEFEFFVGERCRTVLDAVFLDQELYDLDAEQP